MNATKALHPCVEALSKLAYGDGEECRWCKAFVGLDHFRECPIRLMAAALAHSALLEDAVPYPKPADFARMTPEEFHEYTERIGFDARITAALAEPVEDAAPRQPEPDIEAASPSEETR